MTASSSFGDSAILADGSSLSVVVLEGVLNEVNDDLGLADDEEQEQDEEHPEVIRRRRKERRERQRLLRRSRGQRASSSNSAHVDADAHQHQAERQDLLAVSATAAAIAPDLLFNPRACELHPLALAPTILATVENMAISTNNFDRENIDNNMLSDDDAVAATESASDDDGDESFSA